jgi:hypothetical protein
MYKDDSHPTVITVFFKARVTGSTTWSNEPSVPY